MPGNWQRWHTGPTWVNAPPGFRAPAPPANSIVINGAPGGRVPRTNIPNEAGGVGARNPGPAMGGRTTNGDGGGGAGFRGNRRVFTNDDVARVPRTDIPKTDVPAKPAPDVMDADNKPKEVERQPVIDVQRQPQVNRSHADREPPANRSDDAASRPSRSRTADSSPAQQPSHAPVDSRPTHQPASPVREYTQPAQPTRQSAPAPAPAPVRQSAPPAASHDDSGSRSSGKPK